MVFCQAEEVRARVCPFLIRVVVLVVVVVVVTRAARPERDTLAAGENAEYGDLFHEADAGAGPGAERGDGRDAEHTAAVLRLPFPR